MSRRDAMIRALVAADFPIVGMDSDEERAMFTRQVDQWIEQGLLPSETAEEEAARLRQRIHEAVSECERRHAPYVSRCEKFDIWSEWARDHFARAGDDTWSHGSDANRLLILSLIEERDAACDELTQTKTALSAALGVEI